MDSVPRFLFSRLFNLSPYHRALPSRSALVKCHGQNSVCDLQYHSILLLIPLAILRTPYFCMLSTSCHQIWFDYQFILVSRGLSKLRELVMDRKAWRVAIHGVAKSRTRLSNWTELRLLEAYLETGSVFLCTDCLCLVPLPFLLFFKIPRMYGLWVNSYYIPSLQWAAAHSHLMK